MDWVELISKVGFPIALCVYFLVKDSRTSAREEKRAEAIDKWRSDHATVQLEVITQNTLAMNELTHALKSRPCLKDR